MTSFALQREVPLGSLESETTVSFFLVLQKGTGMGGQSIEDMERVIAAMRRVVERLQTENDNLKKHPVTGETQLNDLTKENKRLKVGQIP